MADNQEMLEHLAERNAVAIVARNEAAAGLLSFRDYVALVGELTNGAAASRQADIRHDDCPLCAAWTGKGELREAE